MGLYLGGNNERLRVILNGVVYRLNFYTTTAIMNGSRLLSSDNYVLLGSDGYYLTVEDIEASTIDENNNI